MNVITFVMTMLMLLTMMTYARLESFRAFSTVQAQFEEFMETNERAYINERAEQWYDTTKVNDGIKRDYSSKIGSPRISWYVIINQAVREKNPEHYLLITELSKKLMEHLFKNSEKFQTTLKNHPNILNELFIAIANAADKLPQEQKIKSSQDLATLDLEDEELNQLFYNMQKGIYVEKPKAATSHDEVSSDRGDIENQISEDLLEYRSHSHSVSLLDYITLRNLKIKLFLSPVPILEAIFEDNNQAIEDIRTLRYNLYRDLMNKHKTKDQATKEFQTELQSRFPFLSDSCYDFSVTKVNPTCYE